MLHFPRHPAVWFSALLCWFGVLWFLSSLAGSPLKPLPFPHVDKFQHFTYFLAGGFLLTGGIFRSKPGARCWKTILGTSILVMAAIGGLDEWHQTFTPGRSGGDPWDWLADLLGGTAGAFTLKSIHHRIQ